MCGSQSHAALMASIHAAPTEGLLRSADLFDVYRPKPAAGMAAEGVVNRGQAAEKSLAVRLTLNNDDATLTDEEIGAAERKSDGLPQSLAANIDVYGLTHFKLKIGGDVDADRARLAAIARLLEERD